MKSIIAFLLFFACASAYAQHVEQPPSLPLTGGTLTGLLQQTVSLNLVATGTTSGTSLLLTSQINHVVGVNSGTGVRLPGGSAGAVITVINRGSNTLNVYPPASGSIDGGSANAAVTVAANTVMTFTAITNFVWYSK